MLRTFIICLILMTSEASAQTLVSNTPLPEIDKLWDFNNPAETEQKFRELVPKAESSGDANYVLELQTQIARTQGLQRKFDDAHKTLDAVRAALDMLRDTSVRASLRYELERGRILNSSDRKSESIPHFERALELGTQMKDDVLAIDAAHMLGIATTGDVALEWNERAVRMAEASSNPRAKGWLGALYNNIGWTYHDMGKYEVALNYFERDLKWYEERKLENQSRIARWSIAKMHRLLGDPKRAFDEQKGILAEIEAKDVDPDGYVFEELGECSLALDRDEAEWKGYLRKAYDLLSKDEWSVANELKKHERLKELLGID
jgi:tetratricopeptide (TPR) repeat protein